MSTTEDVYTEFPLKINSDAYSNIQDDEYLPDVMKEVAIMIQSPHFIENIGTAIDDYIINHLLIKKHINKLERGTRKEAEESYMISDEKSLDDAQRYKDLCNG